MKPSERIKEIAEQLNGNYGEPVKIMAILQYLDEEYKKKHTHEVGTACNEC